ncbi:MAG: hypothetical protein KatS3mg111_2067 [Pirellulaceae bacterium]|nr:MAG: hypothetical protein KatS3mg111_2067 [Pirellulaceae bacterium]
MDRLLCLLDCRDLTAGRWLTKEHLASQPRHSGQPPFRLHALKSTASSHGTGLLLDSQAVTAIALALNQPHLQKPSQPQGSTKSSPHTG